MFPQKCLRLFKYLEMLTLKYLLIFHNILKSSYIHTYIYIYVYMYIYIYMYICTYTHP